MHVRYRRWSRALEPHSVANELTINAIRMQCVGGWRVRMDVNGAVNIYVFFFLFFFFLGGGGGGGQGRCEWRSEAFVKIKKKIQGGGGG